MDNTADRGIGPSRCTPKRTGKTGGSTTGWPAPSFRRPHNTGDIEPTTEPVPGKDVSDLIRAKAREMGFGEVGFTRFDRRYVYRFKKAWTKYPHAICLAYEQDYEATQGAPSREAEGPHYARLSDHGRAGPGPGGLRPQSWLPRPGAQPPVQLGGVHTHVRPGGPWPVGSQRTAPVAPLRLQGQADDDNHRCHRDPRQAHRLRNPRLLQHLPGVCQPLPGPCADEG